MFKFRNLLSLLLALMLVVSLAACANTQEENDQTSDDTIMDEPTNDTAEDEVIDDTTEPETDEGSDDVIEDVPADDNTAAAGELGAFFETLTENYEMAALADMDHDLIDAYLPGLNDIALSEAVLKMPMMSAVVCEIYLVKCENTDDAAKVEQIFQDRKQAQVDGGAWYPESIATWEIAEIVTSDNYVALFAHSHAAEMAADFENAF